MTAYSIALTLHIAAGALALTLFWTAAVAKKGSTLHRRVGKIYLLAMLVVIISGVPLAYAVMQRGSPVSALFLLYLLLLVSAGCSNAWRAIRHRQNPRAYFGAIYWFFAVMLAGSGIGMIGLGHSAGSALLIVFGGVGVLVAAGAIQAWRRAPRDPKWWLKEHYGAMIGNGVATHIAFLAVGLRNIGFGIDPQLQQHIAWFGPLLAAVVAAIWLNRKYGRPTARAQPSTGTDVERVGLES